MGGADLFHSGEERLNESFPGLLFGVRSIAVHSQPGFDKWTEKPGPYRALMVRSIPLENASFITRRVASFTRRQRTQADRRQKVTFHGIHDCLGLRSFQHWKRQTSNGKNLVWTQR